MALSFLGDSSHRRRQGQARALFFSPRGGAGDTISAHVRPRHRTNSNGFDFSADDDLHCDDSYDVNDKVEDAGDSNIEYRSLLGRTPSLETRREQARRKTFCSVRLVLMNVGMFMAGCCVAFAFVSASIRNAAPTSTPTGDGTPPSSLTPVFGDGGDDKRDKSLSPRRFRISDSTESEFVQWSERLYESTGLSQYDGGHPDVNWTLGHPRRREDRFPSVEERIRYYMGRFYDPPGDKEGVDVWGNNFLRDTYELQRTTRTFSISSPFAVNLYDFDVRDLVKCDEEENTVLHAYCRDYVDFAILHRDMSAGAIQHLGDSLPLTRSRRTSPNKKRLGVGGRGGGYPVFNKVRHYCDIPTERTAKYPEYITPEDRNPNCDQEDKIDTILWPLNRHRHFTPAAQIGPFDVPWSEKLPRAIWRGGTNDALSDRKYALVSRHENSTLVDAKFAERENKRGRHRNRTDGLPEEWLSEFLDKEEQLRYRYLISIEGNDVSSGLKWMLFSNSVVLLPPTTFESWAMEGILEPYVHYIPIKSDMSDVEKQILWAESHPTKSLRIAQRSTLFVYDLLFHPDAMRDERAALRGIAERYEENFGYMVDALEKHPLGHVRHWDSHPNRREDRFPGVEERVRYYMGRWSNGDGHAKVDMTRREGNTNRSVALPPELSNLNDTPKIDSPFIASGRLLEKCASMLKGSARDIADTNDGPDDNSEDNDARILAEYCDDSLPFFDERLIHDIVSTRRPDRDPSLKLAPCTKDTSTSEKKWFKRILVDDSVKVLHFGEPAREEEHGGKGASGFPVFAGTKRTTELGGKGRAVIEGTKKERSGGQNSSSNGSQSETILWRFGSRDGYDLVRSGLIERLDTPFELKNARAVWRGHIGAERNSLGEDGRSEKFDNQLSLVMQTEEGGKIDARFILPDALERTVNKGKVRRVPKDMMVAKPQGQEELTKYLRHMLSFRYIIAMEDDYKPSEDLKWILLSQSVVFMPLNRRFVSWFMEDTLEPYVHFVPIQANYSDIEEQIAWCEEHPWEVERIAERATLYVHDMLFHRLAAKEDNEVQIRIMERYADRFGG